MLRAILNFFFAFLLYWEVGGSGPPIPVIYPTLGRTKFRLPGVDFYRHSPFRAEGVSWVAHFLQGR